MAVIGNAGLNERVTNVHDLEQREVDFQTTTLAPAAPEEPAPKPSVAPPTVSVTGQANSTNSGVDTQAIGVTANVPLDHNTSVSATIRHRENQGEVQGAAGLLPVDGSATAYTVGITERVNSRTTVGASYTRDEAENNVSGATTDANVVGVTATHTIPHGDGAQTSLTGTVQYAQFQTTSATGIASPSQEQLRVTGTVTHDRPIHPESEFKVGVSATAQGRVGLNDASRAAIEAGDTDFIAGGSVGITWTPPFADGNLVVQAGYQQTFVGGNTPSADPTGGPNGLSTTAGEGGPMVRATWRF